MSENVARYDFYEKVLVDSRESEKARVNGQIDAVLGRVQIENRAWYYTVYVYSTETSWCFFEHELLPTGEQASRNDFYDGSSVRVRVDNEQRGRIVPDDE